MKKTVFILICSSAFILSASPIRAQQTYIGHTGGQPPVPHDSAVLEVEADDKGLLLPRLSSHSVVSNPADGLMIYDISDECINMYDGSNWVNFCESGDGGGSTNAFGCPSSTSPAEITQIASINASRFVVTSNGTLGIDGNTANGLVYGLFPNLSSDQYEEFNFFDADALGVPWQNGSLMEFEVGYDSSGFSFVSAVAIAKNSSGEDAVFVAIAGNKGFFTFTEVTGIVGTPVDVVIASREYVILTDQETLYVGRSTHSSLNTTPSLITPPNGQAVTDIYAGAEKGQAMLGGKYIETTDGTVYGWGNKDTSGGGWSSNSSRLFVENMAEINVPNIKYASRGDDQTLWVTDDGQLYGNGAFWEKEPTPMTIPAGVLEPGETWAFAEAMGEDTAVAITSQGRIYSLFDAQPTMAYASWKLESDYAITNIDDIEISYSGGLTQNSTITEYVYARIGTQFVTWQVNDPQLVDQLDNSPVIVPLCD